MGDVLGLITDIAKVSPVMGGVVLVTIWLSYLKHKEKMQIIGAEKDRLREENAILKGKLAVRTERIEQLKENFIKAVSVERERYEKVVGKIRIAIREEIFNLINEKFRLVEGEILKMFALYNADSKNVLCPHTGEACKIIEEVNNKDVLIYKGKLKFALLEGQKLCEVRIFQNGFMGMSDIELKEYIKDLSEKINTIVRLNMELMYPQGMVMNREEYLKGIADISYKYTEELVKQVISIKKKEQLQLEIAQKESEKILFILYGGDSAAVEDTRVYVKEGKDEEKGRS